MFRNSVLLILLLLATTFSGAQQKPATHKAKPAATVEKDNANDPKLPSEDTVISFLQQMFGYEPMLSWKVASIRPSRTLGLAEVTFVLSTPQGQQSSVIYVSADGKHAVVGEVIPFGTRPFDATRDALMKGLNGPARGPANAPVTIVEFGDLQCPHCKDAQPIIEKLIGEESDARLVFQNFPLDIPTHDWAAKGAAYADCIGRTSGDAFWKFLHDVYEGQKDITAANADEKLNALADQAGVKSADVAACAAKPETTTRVQESVALGKAVGVNSTPTVFINGRKLEGITSVPYEVVKKLVEFAMKDSEDQEAKAK